MAWPFDQLDAKFIATEAVPMGERKHAPWQLLKKDMDEYVTLGKGYQVSDFGDDAYPEDGSSPRSDKPVW